nr:MAG TPA: hypothetical protein [Caudoviricetes sp.]
MKQTLFFCCPKAGTICLLQMTAVRRGKERKQNELHDSR